MSKKICVIGLGYIGLPTATVFADNGFEVTGVDIDQSRVDELYEGNIKTKENGLAELARKLVEEGKLHASTQPVASDVFIIAVPTPHNSDLTANMDYVKHAITSLLPVLEKGNSIIVESTIPPRTTRDIIAPIMESDGFIPGKDVFLSHCPERVLPGRILEELYENNRIVGGINPLSAKKAADIYRTFVTGKVIETSAESAEMAKLMENTYRSVNIALANELSKISEGLKIDPLEVISLANEHPRVNIHQPGPGVGGHCIAVDPYFIMEKDPVNTKLISKAMSINESMPGFILQQVKKVITTGKIAVFGLAYKGNIDDIRESPAVKIVERLIEGNYHVGVYDPYVKQEQVPFKLSSFEQSLENADMLLILTDHNEFKTLDWDKVKSLMRIATVLDTKNCVKNDTNKVNYYSFKNLYELPNHTSPVNIGK